MHSFNNFANYIKLTVSISELVNYKNLEILYDSLYKAFFNDSRIFLDDTKIKLILSV